MPNIEEYDPTVPRLQPSETGVESWARAGVRGGAFFNEAGSMIDQAGREIGSAVSRAGELQNIQQFHQEVVHGAPVGSKMVLDLTNQWNDTFKDPSLDPNNTSIGPKFLAETVEPKLQEFLNGFQTQQGQQWATEYVDKVRNHFTETTIADMSHLAGEAVVQGIGRLSNDAANTAFNDPTKVPFLLDTLGHQVDGIIASSPGLKGTDIEKARMDATEKTREAIVKFGAIGAIQKSANPEATAQQWIAKYPEYIKGEEIIGFMQNARQQIRARNFDDQINERRAKEQAQEVSNDKTAQYLLDIRNRDPKIQGDPTAQKILNDQGLLKADKNNLLNLIDRELKPETDARTSHQTFVDLLRQMRAEGADPDTMMQKAWDARLLDAGKPGSLNEQDFNQFRNEIIAEKTPDGEALARDRTFFFKQYGQIINPITDTTGEGAQRQYIAEQDARRRENDLRAKGNDPASLYDPHSSNFFGSPENMAKYRGSLQDALSAYTGVRPTATSTPGVSAGPPVSLPPLKDRKAGQQYMTPRGMMTWTGTGWLPLQAPTNAPEVPIR